MKPLFLTDYRQRSQAQMIDDLNASWVRIKALEREKNRMSGVQQSQEAKIDKLKGKLWLVMAFCPLLAAALVSFVDWVIR